MALVERHKYASGLVVREFLKSAHLLPAILHRQPSLFDRQTAWDAEQQTLKNLEARAMRLTPLQIKKLAAFFEDVSDHMRGMGEKEWNREARLLFDVPSNGSMVAVGGDMRDRYRFGFDQSLVTEVRKLEILAAFQEGKLSPRTAASRAFKGGTVALRREKRSGIEGVKITHISSKDTTWMPAVMNLASARERLAKRVAGLIYLAGRGLHPDFSNSYFVASLDAVRKKRARGTGHARDINRHLASLGLRSYDAGPTATRWLAFMGSTAPHLRDIVAHAKTYPLPSGIPHPDKLEEEIGLIIRVKRGNFAAIADLLRHASLLPFEQQAAFFIRHDASTLERFERVIKRRKLETEMPQTVTAIQMSREMLPAIRTGIVEGARKARRELRVPREFRPK